MPPSEGAQAIKPVSATTAEVREAIRGTLGIDLWLLDFGLIVTGSGGVNFFVGGPKAGKSDGSTVAHRRKHEDPR